MAMAGDYPLNNSTSFVPPSSNFNTLGWTGTYWPNIGIYPSWPYQPQPRPCPSCGHCPTCGNHRPTPYVTPHTWTVADTATITGGQFDVTTTAPNVASGSVQVRNPFTDHLNHEEMRRAMDTATNDATCPAEPDGGDCAHD